MNLTTNEILVILKRKVNIITFFVLTFGIIATAILSVSQSTRIIVDNQRMDGKEAVRYAQEETKVVEGKVTNEDIQTCIEYLYQLNESATLSDDDKINILFQEDTIKYQPYTNFLLDIYENKQQSYMEAYKTLYTLGASSFDVYDVWKQAVVRKNQNLGEAQKEDVLHKISNVEIPMMYESKQMACSMLSSSKFQDAMLLLYVLTAIMFASIFSKDRFTKAEQVICATTLGRKKLRKARCNAVWIISSILFVYTVLVYLCTIWVQIGFGGFSTSIQLGLNSLSPYNLTMGSAILIILFLAYIMHMFITMIILYVSSKTKKAYQVILISFLCLFLSYMMTQTVSFEGVMKYVWMLLPFAFFETSAVFSYCSLVIGPFSIWYPWMACSLFLCIIIILRYRIIRRGH